MYLIACAYLLCTLQLFASSLSPGICYLCEALSVMHTFHHPSNFFVGRQSRIVISQKGVRVSLGMSSSTSIDIEAGTSNSEKKRTKIRSKFAGLMAGELSVKGQAGTASNSPQGYPAIEWKYNPLLISKSGARENSGTAMAVLPDDDLPSEYQDNAPPSHHSRVLHLRRCLLTQDEVSSLLQAAINSGDFQEHKSRCVVAVEDGRYQKSEKDDEDHSYNSLSSLLRPILETKILPWARLKCNVPTLAVADALVRSYDSADGREDLAPHYDVTAYATIIIPLSDPEEYEGGLYVQTGASVTTRKEIEFEAAGDAVLHRYDVMHGVNVRSGRRCSLIIWFAEDEESVTSKTVSWISREAIKGLGVHAAFLHGFNAQAGLYGVEQDTETAKRFYTWAARRGHALAAHNLSLLHNKERNPVAARELLQVAAERGLSCAQHELGVAYKQGYLGFKRNTNVAKLWLRRAAQQGYRQSFEILEDPSRW